MYLIRSVSILQLSMLTSTQETMQSTNDVSRALPPQSWRQGNSFSKLTSSHRGVFLAATIPNKMGSNTASIIGRLASSMRGSTARKYAVHIIKYAWMRGALCRHRIGDENVSSSLSMSTAFQIDLDNSRTLFLTTGTERHIALAFKLCTSYG